MSAFKDGFFGLEGLSLCLAGGYTPRELGKDILAQVCASMGYYETLLSFYSTINPQLLTSNC